jgi:hypothetical protein
VAGAGAQSYNSAGAGDEKPEFAQHYFELLGGVTQPPPPTVATSLQILTVPPTEKIQHLNMNR